MNLDENRSCLGDGKGPVFQTACLINFFSSFNLEMDQEHCLDAAVTCKPSKSL